MHERTPACSFAVTLLLVAPTVAQSASLQDLTRLEPGVSKRVSSAHPDALSNHDNKWVRPGETIVLADLHGAGVITHLWLTFASPEPNWLSRDGSARHDELVLRMFWDGGEQPAVEAPLGDFFACGFGERVPVESAPVVVQGGDAYNCYWRMPYREGARVATDRPTSSSTP